MLEDKVIQIPDFNSFLSLRDEAKLIERKITLTPSDDVNYAIVKLKGIHSQIQNMGRAIELIRRAIQLMGRAEGHEHFINARDSVLKSLRDGRLNDIISKPNIGVGKTSILSKCYDNLDKLFQNLNQKYKDDDEAFLESYGDKRINDTETIDFSASETLDGDSELSFAANILSKEEQDKLCKDSSISSLSPSDAVAIINKMKSIWKQLKQIEALFLRRDDWRRYEALSLSIDNALKDTVLTSKVLSARTLLGFGKTAILKKAYRKLYQYKMTFRDRMENTQNELVYAMTNEMKAKTEMKQVDEMEGREEEKGGKRKKKTMKRKRKKYTKKYKRWQKNNKSS